MRKPLVALSAVFLAAHLFLLPPSLEDIDSVNFALGVRDFDVARHQPHPPGYPIFIAAAKASTALMHAAGVPAPETRGLAVWSALSGAALVFFLFALFKALGDGVRGGADDGAQVAVRRAWWAMVIAVSCPLFWFTALRPLSDSAGLAAAVAAQALLAAVVFSRGGTRMLLAGALVAGLAIGVRSQTFALTLPMLALVLVWPGLGLRLSDRIAAVAAASFGVLAWAVPLMLASGGPAAYADALGSQAGEDFSGVVMLWTARSARVAADAAHYTFLAPWAVPALGVFVVVAALAGAVRVGWQAPRVLLVVAVAFVPFTVFHLLFHEVVTVRYALPLIVPAAFLAAAALDRPRWLLPAAATALAVIGVAVSAAPSLEYARSGGPASRLVEDLQSGTVTLDDQAVAASFDAIGLHAVARRAFEWTVQPKPVLVAPHGREWLRLLQFWRDRPGASVAFAADPRRTDLALLDPRSRRLVRAYRWGFAEPPFVGGARPGNSDLYLMGPPGWMLDRGWALTAEVAGVSTRDGLGPHIRPSVAWVRARPDAADLVLGGRHLGAADDPPVTISVTRAGQRLDEWTSGPGFFMRRISLPAGALSGAPGYLAIEVGSQAVTGARTVPVALEQFDLQPAGVPMVAFDAGWQEPELNPSTAASWRWMSERGQLWVRPVGRDVSLTIAGESPLRYFERAPSVTVAIGEREVTTFTPASDFAETIVLPAGLLASAGGQVRVTSDQHFVPADRDGSADRRRLALRIFRIAVE